ncbi:MULTISPECIES: arginine N-succinyltransferase [Halomonas]|uniref:Arginine N-succinyltransferase n=2 Tax=Halomonas TaxID=2745 RepID=A0AAU7KVZ9_9GAMM|nr:MULTISPECIES: arginine N-succinyltransferase [Halomonas]MBR9770809.1 arginine N-succinyltransferase [Gammaproteobacteria bacterium]KJZ18389.1 arginine succinyltransferase [Halomonas sp. S2151]MAR72995.1 arginine N-succinyltransferase [Halomonas sp.]MBR9877923.1 arginine N-succinyltransferase [Gammaproteobacteria bacterium]MBS8268401.1 arginine N-succinyltransferase [Halomonas litopenaei]|tara:strand:+ start:3368 stop:4411 length:1044 start_codon:yes stop_codon:yes gene_type:complete
MRMRPIMEGDLDELQALARETGVGFTSLPDNREFLADKIASATSAFNEQTPVDQRLYFFVLEDEESGHLAGCCAIEGQVGREVPFYHYRVGTLAHSSKQLDLHRTVDTLFLSSDHTGDAEVASLFLRPEFRGADRRHQRNGALLSMMRWLFMAEFRDRFPEKVLAEMRGRFDENGRSAFWDCLGANFFPMDFNEADRLTGLGQKSFIGELMPKFPIYTPFLSEQARACIGQVHEHTRPALAMLKKQGLRWEGYIDIFDGGPTVEAYIDDVKGVRLSRHVRVEVDPNADSAERPQWLAATTRMADFRAAWVGRGPDADGVLVLNDNEARRLEVASGDTLRVLNSDEEA